MSDTPHLISVVIATQCDEARAASLKRACESVRSMANGHRYSIIVVANGPRVCRDVIHWLSERADVRLVRLRSGSAALARRVGAEIADGEFLAFLDDDDELLPGTLAPKIEHFRQNPDVDVLVTDGWRVSGERLNRIFPPPEARSEDLIETLMRAGWGACSLTLRAKNIDLAAFDAEVSHMEWTLTTLKLARRHRFSYLDEPMYRYYDDTPDSLSKKPEHVVAAPEVWRKLSREYADTPYYSIVRRRYGKECFNAAWACARQGRMRQAWQLYGRSWFCPGAVYGMPLFAKLVLASVRRIFAPAASR